VDFSNLAGIKLVMTTAFEQSASGDTVAIQDITKKIF
jgi:hypothetical protein